MTSPTSSPIYDVDEPAPVLGGRPLQPQRGAGDAVGAWVEQNARVLGGAALVAALAVAGGFAWRASNRATAERADRALYEAEARYAQNDPGAAQALQQVNTRYGDTPAGAHARALLAQLYYDQGKYADGLRVLNRGSVPAAWQETTGRLRAVGEAGAGRPREAAAEFERLAKNAGPDAQAQLLGEAARAYEAAGATADAKRVWQQIIDSGARGAADEARVRLGELSARSAS